MIGGDPVFDGGLFASLNTVGNNPHLPDSLAVPWHWVPRHMAYLAPERTGDKRAIEISFFSERDDLHIFTANDSDDVGYRDSVHHWRSTVSSDTKSTKQEK